MRVRDANFASAGSLKTPFTMFAYKGHARQSSVELDAQEALDEERFDLLRKGKTPSLLLVMFPQQDERNQLLEHLR